MSPKGLSRGVEIVTPIAVVAAMVSDILFCFGLASALLRF